MGGIEAGLEPPDSEFQAFWDQGTLQLWTLFLQNVHVFLYIQKYIEGLLGAPGPGEGPLSGLGKKNLGVLENQRGQQGQRESDGLPRFSVGNLRWPPGKRQNSLW